MSKSFHWRKIETSAALQLLRDIAKEASGPLTQGDILLECQRRGTMLLNIPTLFGELGMNPGYRVSDGLDYGQKKGPAVLFPDRKYRYWLVSAPGWVQSWHVTRDFKVVHGGEATTDEGQQTTAAQPETKDEQQVCGHCGSEITSGAFCNEACRNAFFEKLRGAK